MSGPEAEGAGRLPDAFTARQRAMAQRTAVAILARVLHHGFIAGIWPIRWSIPEDGAVVISGEVLHPDQAARPELYRAWAAVVSSLPCLPRGSVFGQPDTDIISGDGERSRYLAVWRCTDAFLGIEIRLSAVVMSTAEGHPLADWRPNLSRRTNMPDDSTVDQLIMDVWGPAQ